MKKIHSEDVSFSSLCHHNAGIKVAQLIQKEYNYI